MSNVKETKEAAAALIAIGKKVAKAYKIANADGKLEASDLITVLPTFMGADFLATVKAGVDGIDKCGDELKALDGLGYLELGKDVVVDVIDALKEVQA